MWLLYLFVGLTTAGVLVLGVLGIRVFTEVGRLARQVGQSSDDLGRAADALRRAAEPVASRAGDLSRR